MNFSMDGFRRQLSMQCVVLKLETCALIDGENKNPQRLIEAVNNIIRHSNVLNCVYDPVDASFSDMSEMEVTLIDRGESDRRSIEG